MKKFLLVAVAALAVVACKKDDDKTPDNGGGNGGGTQTNTQAESPYSLGDITYPKTVVTLEEDNTRYGNDLTTTATYTVSPKKLLTQFTSTSKYNQTTTAYSNSKTVLTYDEKDLLKEAVTTNLNDNTQTKIQILYVNGRVDKIFETYANGKVATTTYTYNGEGKVHTIHKKDEWSDMKTTVTYSGNEIIEEVYDNDENNIYSKDKITLDANGNVVKSEDLKHGGHTTYTYDNKKNYENNEVARILSGFHGLKRAGYSKNNVISTLHSSTSTPTAPTFEYTDNGYIKKKTNVSVNTYGDPRRPQTQVVTTTTTYNY